MRSSYQIAGKPGYWRLQGDRDNHVIFWKFGGNRRISVAIPKNEIADKVMERVMRRINLSSLEALRGE